MLNEPGVRLSAEPCFIFLARTETLASSAGTTPRTIAGWLRGPDSSASFSMYGAAPATRGSCMATWTACGQSRIGAPSALTVACAAICSRRSRISFWKPLITDSVVISTVTPRAMPRIDAIEMKEMKPLRRLARR